MTRGASEPTGNPPLVDTRDVTEPTAEQNLRSLINNRLIGDERVWALELLDAIIADPDLEWGKPGDCWDRLINDDEPLATFALKVGAMPDLNHDATRDAFRDWAAEEGFGRHYGNPHCIWCLEGQ